jgi:hypothetical protein
MKGNCGSTKARAASIEENWAKPKPFDWPVKTTEAKRQGNRQWNCPGKDASDGQVPVDLSRMIVTVSTAQPWPLKNV